MNLILKSLALTLLAYLLPLAVLILGSVGLLTPKGTHQSEAVNGYHSFTASNPCQPESDSSAMA
jgi:hypothetical protein